MHPNHAKQLPRLRRVEGQVAGVIRMVDERRYCVDILAQIRAIRAALKKVEQGVLRQHMEHCVVAALEGDDPVDTQKRIDEVLNVFARYTP